EHISLGFVVLGSGFRVTGFGFRLFALYFLPCEIILLAKLLRISLGELLPLLNAASQQWLRHYFTG
ncbi:MAG: hypothetical protein KAX05_03085, partial [Bacteroidales bacterium]|nr:hypothetical protein [Bacteroidales bacterium]